MIVLLLTAAFLTLAFFTLKPSNKALRQKLPPGPPGILILGNLLQLPALRPHPKLREWAAEYGEIFHLKLGGQDVIVLNSADAADELLARRSSNFSSRVMPHVAGSILRGGLGITFLKYDSPWKILRKAMQTSIGPGPSKRLYQVQEFETLTMLYDLSCHGDKSAVGQVRRNAGVHDLDDHWFAPVRRYATSVTLYAVYGKRLSHFLNNRDLHRIYDIFGNMVQVSQPGNYLADVFPIFRLLPDFLAPWRTECQRLHESEGHFWQGLVSECKVALQNGEERGGFVNSYLSARTAAGHGDAPGGGFTDGWMQDKFLAFGAGTALEAGSDTTAMGICTFILYMLSHPEVLKKAREEVDSVVGADRMPDWDDEPHLPYVVACIKELLRHRPAAPLGIPHSPLEDDFYKNYYIPKGCSVIGNIWAINRDPKRFHNPTAFMPERFYEPGKPTSWGGNQLAQDREHYAFGWGRRFCAGSHVAQASLFIAISRLVWGIDFSAPIDSVTGRPRIPDIADEEACWTPGWVSTPYPFNVRFAPRSAKHADLIRDSFEAVQAQWRKMRLDVDER